MRVFALLLVAALLLGAAPALAQDQPWPELRVDPGRVELAPGGDFHGELTVRNPGTTNRTVPLSATSSRVGVFLDASTVALGPGETKRVGFRVSVPADVPESSVLIQFAGAEGGAYAFVHVVGQAGAPYDAGLLPGTDVTTLGGPIAEGGHYEGNVVVTNIDNATRTFPVRIRVPDGWAPTLSTTSLTLASRQSATISVRADPGPDAVNGTGAIEIGDARAHTAVSLYLNMTYAQRVLPKPARVVATLDAQALSVEAGGTVGVRLTLANDGDEDWTGPILAPGSMGFAVEGPTQATVPSRGATTLDYVIRAAADLRDGEQATLRFVADGSEASVLVTASRPPPLPTPADINLVLDPDEVQLFVGERAPFNVRVANDAGGTAASGDLVLDVPPGLVVEGSTSYSVAAYANVTLPLVVVAAPGQHEAIDGTITITAGPDASATLAVRLRPAPAPAALAISLDPSSLGLEVGETRLVRATVAHVSGDPWRGQLELHALGNATALALSSPVLDLAPGGSVVVNVRVGRAGPGAALVEFTAGDAQATLLLDDPTTKPQSEKTEAGGIGAVSPPVLAALVAAGVGATAGGVALGQRRWPLFFAGLYARLAPSRLLEHPMRARIRRLVEESPGVTRNEIGRRLGLAPGALDHHLGKLASGGFLVAVPDGQLRRFFVAGSARPEARAALDERIVAHLRERGPTSAADVAQALGASRQALHYHLRRMAREGSVVVERGPRGLTLRAP